MTKIECPHCGKPYLPRGLNTHIGRMHKEEKKLVNPVAKRTVISVDILDEIPNSFTNTPDMDSTPQPIPTAEGATYTKWQRFQNWIKR